MKTFDFLFGDDAAMWWAPVAAGLGIAVQCALLSVLTVLKRLSFVGQGVSHAAFGGVGLAVVLGFGAVDSLEGGQGAVGAAGYLLIVGGFCVTTAMLIAWLSDRRGVSADTAIGILLVAAMALGALLLHLHRLHAPPGVRTPNVEEVLFGSLTVVGWADAAAAWGCAAAVGLVLWGTRRGLLFWAFDESAAEAAGVPTRRVRLVLMTLLALVIVVSMRLAGVVLATALLVLPGAAALRLSHRLARVMMLSVVVSVLGVAMGLVASFEWNLPPGPCIVTVLAGLFLVTMGAGRGGK